MKGEAGDAPGAAQKRIVFPETWHEALSISSFLKQTCSINEVRDFSKGKGRRIGERAGGETQTNVESFC